MKKFIAWSLKTMHTNVAIKFYHGPTGEELSNLFAGMGEITFTSTFRIYILNIDN